MTDRQMRGYLSIGQFARLTQLSHKALRVYARQGVLTPAYVDPDSGYRYYTQPQLQTARRIRLLRTMEMPLRNIQQVLAAWETLAARQLIDAHCERLAQRVEAARVAARLLLTPDPVKELWMNLPIQTQSMPAQKVASIRKRIRVPAYHTWIPQALAALRAHIQAAGATISGAPLALYYGPVNEEDNGPVEIAYPFQGYVAPEGEIEVRTLPAHQAVVVEADEAHSDYPKILEVWDAVSGYVQQHALMSNWEGNMSCYEIWHEHTLAVAWPVYLP